ncbi:MAG TPA: phage holin family protein [Chloroflexota bacterium]|jgi:fatty acid desaturase
MAQQISDLRTARDERSLGDLFGDLSRETTNLIRQEVTLAKVELSQKATQMGKDAAMLAAGGALLYAGLLALIAAAIIGLAQAWAWWLSALVIGVIVVGVGGLLVLSGLKAMRRASLVPTQTVQTLKEDAQWAKNQIR